MVAGVDYGYPWDRPLADLKFHQRLEPIGALLRPLARAAAATCAAATCAWWPCRCRANGCASAATTSRGSSRAGSPARSRSRRAPTPCSACATPATSWACTATRARANLQGAFVVTPRHAAWVRGARIALVDDVLTTGATAHAATRTLRAAGARDVQVWVVARTPEA